MHPHIVIDARESGTSTGRYVDKLIEHLHPLKPKFNITVLTKKHRLQYLKNIAPSFNIVETPYTEFGFGEQMGLLKQINSLKPDLVHFGMVQQPLLYRGKVITTMHDLTATRFRNPSTNPFVFTIKQTIYKFVNWYVPHKSIRVIVPTEFVKQDIMQYAHIHAGEKFVVTLESADVITEKPSPVKGLDGTRFIMYTGRPQPHKNLSRLIDAFVILKQQHPGLYLVLVGKKDALYQQHEARVKAENIRDVIFTDFIDDGQLRWLYEHCVAYVAPALSEGFGLPGLEAMRHGAPVISSNTTCLPEVYGQGASYFDPYDVRAIADAISKVVTDTALRSKLVAAGKKQVSTYSWDRMAKQTLDVYMSELQEK